MTEKLLYIPLPGQELSFIAKLLKQVTGKGHKVIVQCNSEGELKKLDDLLWSSEQLSFIPHLTMDDPLEMQKETPVNLYLEPLNNVGADVLVLQQPISANYNDYEKILVISKDALQDKNIYDKIVVQQADNSWQVAK